MSSLSGGLLSPTGDYSQDEDEKDVETDEDSDRYEDLSSDGKNDNYTYLCIIQIEEDI